MDTHYLREKHAGKLAVIRRHLDPGAGVISDSEDFMQRSVLFRLNAGRIVAVPAMYLDARTERQIDEALSRAAVRDRAEVLAPDAEAILSDDGLRVLRKSSRRR